MAVTTEFPVSHPVRLQPLRFPVAIVASVLAVTAVLVFIAVSRPPATAAPSGHGAGTSVTVPHPSPGPFGS